MSDPWHDWNGSLDCPPDIRGLPVTVYRIGRRGKPDSEIAGERSWGEVTRWKLERGHADRPR